MAFNRIASFVVASQIDPTSNTNTETAAEIVAASTDGNTLVYSNSPQGTIGFVDITDPAAPVGLGELDMDGEPTSVTVLGNYVLVAVNTSADFLNPSGQLRAIDLTTQQIIQSWDIGGQPDSIAVSPDGTYAVIAIENERDEDLNDGALPQLPAGNVVIVNTADADPANWTTSVVTLTGLTGLTEATDPEPELVDISTDNIAAVTLQENNAIVLIDLATGTVINSFSAGTVDLTGIDTEDERPNIIDQTSSLDAVPREPDGITFIGTEYIATADEGDLDGGSRGFTIFDLEGNVVYTSGNEMDRIAAQLGHYPDRRSDAKGNEPENIEFGTFDGNDYLFVNSERSSLVFVYNVNDPTSPVLEQVLPAGVAPEGGKAIPDRNLLVVASEADDRSALIRSVVNIYQYSDAAATYPTLQSVDGANGAPIPWGAMSGLAAGEGSILYAVEDSFYASNRFFTIDTSTAPASLTTATTIKDTNGVFAALRPDRVNADADQTVNIDPEGIAATGDGFLWIASEGAGAAADANKILNYLFKVDAATGTIAEVVTLPDEINANQIRFGLEGVAYDEGKLTVVLQRAWTGDANPRVLVYDTETSEWVGDYFYPLDAVESQNGGWVGLSDISPLGNNNFLVLERDNQGSPDAAVKRLYSINLSGLEAGDTIEKEFVRNLIPDFTATGGLMPEKLEGLAVTEDNIWIINDNDGVNDNSGETQLISLDFSAKIGETTALIPQAGSSTLPEHLVDGESGDTDFPYGTFKALATVGEIDPNTGHVLTGYPDGQAAWLLDEDTIRVVYQSESYATMSNETYPWFMDSGVSFTGSHVHAIDYNRAAFADFLNNDSAASEMFEGAGHLFSTVYNVFGEMVDGKNADTSDLSAKWGNQTGADGTLYEFDEDFQLTQADWFFHSFCGAYYEQANKYGDGIGFADDVWLMGEEWNIGFAMYASRGGDDFFTDNTMGLASMVVDIANEVAYTAPVLGQSGYEKIMPINSGHEDYVVLVMSGYNLEVEPAPLKIYIGKKDFDASGNAIDYGTASERDAFLARNGLLFGQLYGMAATDETYAALGITTVDADTEMLNAYATDGSAPDTFSVRYYATDYRWDGFDTPENAGDTEVYRWLQDGDTVEGVVEADEQPDGYTFFNGDSKVEHPAVDPDITQSRYVINLTDARSILGIDFNNIVTDLENDADGNGLPDYLSADVTRILAGVDGSLTLETNGKGAAHIGPNNPDDGESLTHATHVERGRAYADQPDGLQWVKTADGDYLIVDEDSGNDYGERKYVLPIDSETLQLTDPGTGYFLASAGGSLNPRAEAGVAAIPGTFSRATGAEFSGTWNVSHLVAQKEDGTFYTQEELAGTGIQEIIGSLPLEEQSFIGVVQQASESGGLVADRLADQGGQIFLFNITEPLPAFTLQLLHYYGESGLLGIETAPIMGALIDKFDDEYTNTLVLGEGDSYIPGPWLIGGADPSLSSVPGIGSTALGRPDIAIMNAFGTDASALGNHEFDLGSPVLSSAINASGAWVGAQFPLITANLTFAADSSLRGLADATLGGTATNAFAGQEASNIKGKIAPYTVVTQNGEKIGIVGATTYDLLIKTSPNGTVPKDDGNLSTDDLQEVAAYIQAAVNSLTALGVNKIVMVDQLDTIDRNKLLAPLVSGIDVMIAGGGHERMGDATDTAVGFNGHTADFIEDAYPIVTAGLDGKTTLIVTTDTEYTYLGRLVVDFDANGEIIVENLDTAINGAYAATEATLQAAYGTTQTAEQIIASSTIGTQVDAITDAINAVISTKDGTLWGYTNVYLEGDRAFGRTQEVNLGDITADANIYAAQQVLGSTGFIASLKNGGGIRASIGSIAEDGTKIAPIANPIANKPAGAISTLDIENALRFDNKLMVFDTTPQGLKNILEFAAGLSSSPSQQSGGYMQIGGVRVSYDPDNATGSKVESIALTDLEGNVTAVVYGNGVLASNAPASISMVSINFTVNGGDGYPIKANGENFRYLLTDGTLSAAIDESLDFTAAANVPANALGEQKAFQEYLQEFHATPATAFDGADTTAALDQRIQNLNFREDAVTEGFDAIVSITTLDANEVEGDSGTTAFTFSVTRSGDVTSTVTVNYTVDGAELNELPDGDISATTDDFGASTSLTGTLTFGANETSKVLTVDVAGDTIPEVERDFPSRDAFVVSLSSPSSGAALSQTATSATGYIINDDAPAQPFIVAGTPGDDDLVPILDGFSGFNSLVFTGAGSDEVDIPAGGDNLLGSNRIFTGSSSDTIFVADSDRAFGGSGDDELDATEATGYRISGGAGNDEFFLGVGGRALGGDGDDTFNVLEGGGNLLSGGAGADTFWILTDSVAVLTTPNTIVDFTIGTDTLGILNQGAEFDFSDLTLTGNEIKVGGNTIAILTGVTTSTLTVNNFQFA